MAGLKMVFDEFLGFFRRNEQAKMLFCISEADLLHFTWLRIGFFI